MAREPEKVNSPVLASIAVTLLCTTIARTQDGHRADVLIAERPDRLTIFNTYQQRLTAEEVHTLPLHVPIIVLQAEDVMGDGFTRCSRVDIAGETYFLPTRSDGTPAGPADDLLLRKFPAALLHGDTIRVVEDGVLSLRRPDGDGGRDLRRGSLLRRIFSWNGSTYVRLLDLRRDYGWVTISVENGRAWEPFREPLTARAGDLSVILPRIRSLASDANRIFRMLYSLADESGRRSYAPPSLHVEMTGKKILCHVEPAVRRARFDGSMNALANEFRRMLAGTGFRCSVADGAIILTPP